MVDAREQATITKNKNKWFEVASTCIHCFFSGSAVHHGAQRCTSQISNRDSFNRTEPPFITQCSCSPLYS